MHYPAKKWVALLLAVWLPFFSGHALATSITMQMMADTCPMMAAMHDQVHDSDHNQVTGTAEQHASCYDNGVCHFACMGYLATVETAVKQIPPVAQIYPQFSTPFRSITSAPLDPPPLARV